MFGKLCWYNYCKFKKKAHVFGKFIMKLVFYYIMTKIYINLNWILGFMDN